jgi:hypothetical protein
MNPSRILAVVGATALAAAGAVAITSATAVACEDVDQSDACGGPAVMAHEVQPQENAWVFAWQERTNVLQGDIGRHAEAMFAALEVGDLSTVHTEATFVADAYSQLSTIGDEVALEIAHDPAYAGVVTIEPETSVNFIRPYTALGIAAFHCGYAYSMAAYWTEDGYVDADESGFFSYNWDLCDEDLTAYWNVFHWALTYGADPLTPEVEARLDGYERPGCIC